MTKILLVENDEMIREMISRWLVMWSYEARPTGLIQIAFGASVAL